VPGLPATGIAPTYNLGVVVMELQRFLNVTTLSRKLVVDGYLGPKTFAAVKKWQTNDDIK